MHPNACQVESVRPYDNIKNDLIIKFEMLLVRFKEQFIEFHPELSQSRRILEWHVFYKEYLRKKLRAFITLRPFLANQPKYDA